MHKQTLREAAQCASPTQRTVLGNMNVTQSSYSEVVTQLFACPCVSIPSSTAKYHIDIAKNKKINRQTSGHTSTFHAFSERKHSKNRFASFIAYQLFLQKLLNTHSLFLVWLLEPLDCRRRIAQGMFSTGLQATLTLL